MEKDSRVGSTQVSTSDICRRVGEGGELKLKQHRSLLLLPPLLLLPLLLLLMLLPLLPLLPLLLPLQLSLLHLLRCCSYSC